MDGHARVFTIGSLARAAGVVTPTIRYYEEIGLLPKAGRSSGGQRHYSRDDVSRLTFIRQCRDFGFSIEQVRVLLQLSISRDRDCTETRDIAKYHLAEVQERLAQLTALESRLKDFVERCDTACAGGPGQECLIFKEMAQPNSCGCR